jgi:alpha,alpha-trehalase
MEPSKIFDYGPLFEAVQLQRVFHDSKTFVDCIPKRVPEAIMSDFLAARGKVNFDLHQFVEDNFVVPPLVQVEVPSGESIEQHIRTLWRVLSRAPDLDVKGSSLLPLPYPYIIPGGRFREIYYWDSYFTMLGLRESGEEDMIENMARNFVFLTKSHGFIPNGNRVYYLSRSQAPCFALIVELIAERLGIEACAEYLPALKAEHDYWMDRTALPTAHVVKIGGDRILNRYYDQRDTPRPEAYAEDDALARRSLRNRGTVMRHVRAAAESGWDFSSRWLADGRHIETIQTTDIVPVDLNCFLYQTEHTLSRAYESLGMTELSDQMALAAKRRKEAILRTCWSDSLGFFCDYEIVTERVSECLSLAGVLPLFFNIATGEQAEKVMKIVKDRFLQEGGVTTTLQVSGQQWDSPNGWAPLHWFTIQGLENYGYHDLAAEIARRWIRLNQKVYDRTGKLMEKYNVVDLNLEADGGEYPVQYGFGWTNGVLLKLMSLYK